MEDRLPERCWRHHQGYVYFSGPGQTLLTSYVEYGHADVTIHNAGDSHVDRLFAGLGETMHGNAPRVTPFIRIS